MINYIIQVILFQVLFLLVYDLFLSKETFFNKNRFYLLSTSLGSFLLPLIKIQGLQKSVPQEYTILLPEVVLSPQKVIQQQVWYQSINYLDVLFWVGVSVFLVVFIIKLMNILQLIFTHKIIQEKDYKLVLLPKNSKAFSFFNYIFLGEEIPSDKKDKIIQHELIHSKQKHTIDLLCFEFLKIFMWFNPMIWVYQHRISLVHEFISDDEVSKSTSTKTYINNLLSEIFQVESISFINQFYKHSLIKKRIRMMTKTKSKQIKQVKYLLLVPVLASMLFYTACSENEPPNEQNMVTEHSTKFKEEIKIRNNNYYLKEEGNLLKIYNEKGKEGHLEDLYMEKKMGELDKNRIVPFSIVHKVPKFVGKEEGKEAFNKNLNLFIKENFNSKLANSLGLKKGENRIWVQFKIDREGNIIDAKARAPHSALKSEALRLIHKLPKMEAGEYYGEKVITSYVLPISFNVE
ncbi:M56 family metallopeptidase [Tenacibaculum sp. IB213877]|uniref:M56 family metallopeptidase n=1 Tax=Tenacibaculum sp. IB213877 TaxID=3097351 RepID=UPI002A5A9415|nr:M56 family metallopeptidase [Tenacibaculum sp. IB213877]MDY0780690.1 M56 family metallopeptidase [Tenacibaculum sp. IB213877]